MRRPMTSTIGVMQFVVQLAQEMMLGVPPGSVHPVNDRLHLAALRRRRQEHEPRACPDVLLEVVAPREHPGTLEHQVDAQLLPGELRWVAAPQRAQLAAGDDQIAAVDDHGLRSSARTPCRSGAGRRDLSTSTRSLTATSSREGSSTTNFRIARPIRPRPLMATLVLMLPPPCPSASVQQTVSVHLDVTMGRTFGRLRAAAVPTPTTSRA